jgi:PhnB protein
MQSVSPYLNFQGNTEEVFNFYKSVFGGEFSMLQRFKDTPGGSKMTPADAEKIMHIALPLCSSVTLMGTDALDSMNQKITFGNNAYICLEPDSKEEADKIFAGLSVGGKVEMAPMEMFWGAYFGSWTDKFGVQWMINLPIKK